MTSNRRCSPRELGRARERMLALQPYFATPAEIMAEEAARAARIEELAASEKPFPKTLWRKRS